MAKKPPLSTEEVVELFSEVDASGLVDPDRKKQRRHRFARRAQAALAGGERAVSAQLDRDRKQERRRRKKVDPLSADDPSGSQVSRSITRTGILCIVGVLVIILGMQVVYGVGRRLNTANLSEHADKQTVEHALESGVEWGNGFTQFPRTFTVDMADEKIGSIEVSVTDTNSKNELEMLSNSQIQAAALATNALLNEKIDRVEYNVYTLTDTQGNFQHDRFFGFLPATGQRRAMLTFVWTKNHSENTSYIDWELKIIGMDDKTAAKIQEQVNSVSSIAQSPSVTQSDVDDEKTEREREQLLHGTEVFHGGTAEKTPQDYAPKKSASAQ